jgi:hypothetical protein
VAHSKLARDTGFVHNQHVRGMTRSSRFALVAACLLGIAWAVAQYLRWEPSGMKRGSFAYTLKVPAAAKALALWSADTPPRYDVARSDGLAPGFTSIQYRSRKSPRDLAPAITASGYKCQWVSESTLTCDRSSGKALQAQVTVHYDATTRTSEVIVHLPK